MSKKKKTRRMTDAERMVYAGAWWGVYRAGILGAGNDVLPRPGSGHRPEAWETYRAKCARLATDAAAEAVQDMRDVFEGVRETRGEDSPSFELLRDALGAE